MKKAKKMIWGYLVGGFTVLGLMPAIIYSVAAFFDKMYRFEIILNSTIRWVIIALFLSIGFIYGIWSILVQNRIGKGGPVEIGKIEISPRTENLVVSGPYHNTRNPMLFGTFLIYLAFAIIINSVYAIFLVIGLIVFMLTVIVKMEEKRLLKDFGSQYEDYRQKVSKFFPWIQKTNKVSSFEFS